MECVLRGHSNNTRHTRGDGRGLTKCHTDLFYFLKRCFDAFVSQFFCLNQDYVSKDTFLLIHLMFSNILVLKISDKKIDGGGGHNSVRKMLRIF
jgi:hypothetical protein